MAAGSKDLTKAIVAIIAIVLAVGFLIRYNHKKSQNPALARDREVLTIDIENGEIHTVTQKAEERFPLKNPNTKRKTLWKAYICHDEQILFPIPPGQEVRACPNCKSSNVGAARIEHKELRVWMPEE